MLSLLYTCISEGDFTGSPGQCYGVCVCVCVCVGKFRAYGNTEYQGLPQSSY